jgi:hypothetical protein
MKGRGGENVWGLQTMTYIRLGKLCAFHAEASWALTARPFCAWHDCRGETIIDLPFCRIIFTPPSILAAALSIKEKPGFYCDEPEYFRLPAADEGTAENRS